MKPRIIYDSMIKDEVASKSLKSLTLEKKYTKNNKNKIDSLRAEQQNFYDRFCFKRELLKAMNKKSK